MNQNKAAKSLTFWRGSEVSQGKTRTLLLGCWVFQGWDSGFWVLGADEKYQYYFGGSNGPPNPILIIKAPVVGLPGFRIQGLGSLGFG